MNFYEKLETDCLARLAPLAVDGIEVEELPELKAGQSAASEVPRVTCFYVNEKSPDVRATSFMNQETDVLVVFRVEALRRKGEKGLYDVIERVRALILGWEPPGCKGEFSYVEGGYDQLEGQTWSYLLTYKTGRIIVRVDDPAPEYTLHQVAYYNTELGETKDDAQFVPPINPL